MNASLPRARALVRRHAPVGFAALAGVAIVLLIGATTAAFQPPPDSAASYADGYAEGRRQGADVQPGELEARTAAAFERGRRFHVPAPADRFAAVLLAMHAVVSAVSAGGPFDQGFALGWQDAVEGRPPRFAE